MNQTHQSGVVNVREEGINALVHHERKAKNNSL
jgi:hypothetical protein